MTDYLLDDTNDLQISNGDFVTGDSTAQNQMQLLYGEKGSYKQYPTVCVGLMSFLKDNDITDLMREIRIQFSADGMTVSQLSYTNGQFQINAPYGN